MKHEEGTFEGVKGLKIFYQAWIPDAPKAIIQLLHGGSGHSGLYLDLVNKLISEKFAVFANDHRGHGRSEGERMHVDSFNHFIEDQKSFYNIIIKRLPNLPVFMIGHSLGGYIASLFAQQYEDLLKGLVLASTGTRIKISLFKRFLMNFFSLIRPRMRVGEPGDPELSTSNPETIQKFKTDPLIDDRPSTIRFIKEVVKAINSIGKKAETLKLPLLLQNASEDRVLEMFNARYDDEAFNNIFKMKDITIKNYQGIGHAIYHEFEDKLKVIFEDLINWLNNHL